MAPKGKQPARNDEATEPGLRGARVRSTRATVFVRTCVHARSTRPRMTALAARGHRSARAFCSVRSDFPVRLLLLHRSMSDAASDDGEAQPQRAQELGERCLRPRPRPRRRTPTHLTPWGGRVTNYHATPLVEARGAPFIKSVIMHVVAAKFQEKRHATMPLMRSAHKSPSLQRHTRNAFEKQPP